MATDIEKLSVVLEGRISQFEKAMARARAVTDTNMRGIERRTTQASARISKNFGGGFSGSIRTAFAGMTGAISGSAIAQISDRFTQAQNALRVTGLEGEALTKVFGRIAAIAQATATPIDAMAKLYGRAAAAQKELGASTQDLTEFTHIVGMALRVNGTSAAEASGALLQLGQALGSARVQAEEFNSINEGMRPLLQAAANGIEQAGGSVAKLKALVTAGKVSNRAFFDGIRAGSDELRMQNTKAVETYAQAWERVTNAVVLAIGGFNRMSDATGSVSKAVDWLVNDISKIPAGLDTTIREFSAIADVMERIANLVPQMQDLNTVKVDPDRISGYGMPAEGEPGGVMTARVGPKKPKVDLNKYPVIGAKTGGKSRTQSSVDQLLEERREIEAEAAALGSSNTEKRIAIELARANTTASTAEGQAIASTVTSIVTAEEAIAAYDAAQREAQMAMQEFAGLLSSAFTDAIVNGEDLNEVMKQLLRTLASQAANKFFMTLLTGGGAPGGGTGGILGALFGRAGALFGRAGGGSVKAGQPYTVGEFGRETFVPTTAGKIVPNSRGQGASYTFATTIDARGSNRSDAELKALMDARDKQLMNTFKSSVVRMGYNNDRRMF